MFDPFTKKRLEKILNAYIDIKIPKHIRHEIRLKYKFRGNNVSLIEERPAYIGDGWTEFDIAQFRLDEGKWKVYWRDSRNKWHFVDDIIPNESFETQLKTVDQNNQGIFWG
jgi:hypothetical protein